MAIRNFWSLDVNEIIVADRLQSELKNYQVFFPLNSQLKDIDLLLVKLDSKKVSTIQVKGSRAYNLTKPQIKALGEGGQSSWIWIKHDTIFSPTNPVDYFIFLIHFLDISEVKIKIRPQFLILPVEELKKNGQYEFWIYVNPKEKKAIDHREIKKQIDFSKFLNKFDLF